MVKSNGKTPSSRKWSYKSFKDHVDSITIDPLSDLTKKSFHNAEISHFLSTLDHWKEVNLSKNFSGLVEVVEPISMSLPQLLYHKETIFNALHKTISLNDQLSLQPSLELLSQFCHDLGPDFIPFYQRSLVIIRDISLNQLNPESLELIFNTLAYIFKYLSKLLSKDLVPTFKTLLPLLTIKNKKYITRFASEAVSFLVRKANSSSLENFLNDAFNCNEILEDENVSYHTGLSIIFSESLKSSSGALHSKLNLILSSLTKICLTNPKFESVLSDVLMELLYYTETAENAKPMYDTVTKVLKNQLENSVIEDYDHLTSIVQALITLSFGESGRKVSCWTDILSLVELLYQSSNKIMVEDDSDELKKYNFNDSMGSWCAILIRNCDASTLTKFHIKIFNIMTNLDDGSTFLSFLDIATSLTRVKTMSYAKKYVLSFITQNWQNHYKEIAYFLQKMNDKGLINDKEDVKATKTENEIETNFHDTLRIVIPSEFKVYILEPFENINSIQSKDALLNYYWRLLILQNTSITIDPTSLIKFLNLLQNVDENLKDLFLTDVIANTLGALSKQKLLDDQIKTILSSCNENFEKLIQSTTFLLNFNKFVSEIDSKNNKNSKSVLYIQKHKEDMIVKLSNILKTPSHEAREFTLNVIISLFEKSNNEIPEPISSCRVIEQVPLDIENARGIPLRYRSMASNYVSASPLTNIVVVSFLFGQITNKFSPTWQGVTEFVTAVINKIADLFWKLTFEAISMKYNKNSLEEIYFEYDFDSLNSLSDISNWLPQDFRLATNLDNAEKVLQSYQQVDQSLIELADLKRKSILPTDFSRYQAIKLLNKVPQVAESNFSELLPYIINEDTDDVLDADAGSPLEGWTINDRNGLVEVLSRFKKLKSVPNIGQVKDLLFGLLMNKQTTIQTLALNCLLNLKDPIYNKYESHLKNLLDDTLFRDEIIVFLQHSEKNIIENNDVSKIMPLVLRILFGRAQTLKTNSTKQGRKVAAIKSLNNFSDKHITEFLELSFCRFNYKDLFNNKKEITNNNVNRRLLKSINGFINLNLDVTHTLGRNHRSCLSVLVEPLIYSLAVSEYTIAHSDSLNDNILEKAARNGRKGGFKLLYNLTVYLGDDYNWLQYGDIIYERLVKSKLTRFGEENLQGPSSLMKTMASLWPQKNLLFFLFYDDNLPVKALLSILPNPNAKDSVLLLVLKFILSLLNNTSRDEKFIEVLTLIIGECLSSLVLIFDNSTNSEVNSMVVQILLGFVSNDYITGNDIRKILIDALTSALEKPNSQIELTVKADIVKIMSLLIQDYDCSLNEITPLYKNIARLYNQYEQREIRIVVSDVFTSISNKFVELEKIGKLISDLNSYSIKKFREPDYEKRLDAYNIINQTEYLTFSTLEWLPILYTVLFFINDEEDQSMRSSASYTLIRYIDCLSNRPDDESALEYVDQLKEIVLPSLRSGLRKKNELIRFEYVSVINHIVSTVKYYHDMDDMKVLLGTEINVDDSDEEDLNFFVNIMHLQTHRRQKALRRLGELCPQLSSNSIAHYILPIVEHYAFWTEEKYRNVSNETIPTIKKLMQHVTFNQFRAIYTRYMGLMNTANSKSQKGRLRDSVLLIVTVSASMKEWSVNESIKPKDYPKIEKIDTYVTKDLIPKLQKTLTARDQDSIVHRVPLTEALISLIMCCSAEMINTELAGILTGICQILRARSEELRDTVRKHLGRIAVSLGPDYLKFIIKELKTALTRGPQIHILSFTIHYILTIMDPYLEHGSLGESAGLIMQAIMNDLFGEASEEKEADGYSNKTKEIKYNKSYDTGEMIAANIFLKDFSHLLTPIKYLLKERLSFKTQNKLDQLLRRFSLGLNKNEESSSTDILVLCNEIYNQAINIVNTEGSMKNKKPINDREEHFLVQLDARPQKIQIEYSLYVKTLQKFSFELLRTAITRHQSLFKVNYLSSFVPLLESSISSEDEGVVVSALKVFTLLVRLDFPEAINAKFTSAARSTIKILKDMPSTNNDSSQGCLKFLSGVIRYKEDLKLKETALSYILKKVEPDLDEPQRQGTAFGFLKSLIFKHYMIAEIYDCMETVSRLMVTSTANEIREVARSVFFTFLMEYDQSRGRLEKQFKLMVNNLKYPAQAGRLSIMELIHMVVKKASKDLLDRLASSFFIALANVSVTDASPSCRESASELLAMIISKLKKNGSSLAFIEKYVGLWLNQNKKVLLLRCGLNVYKIFISSVGYEESGSLNKIALDRIKTTLQLAKRSDEIDDEADNVDWQLIYSCLTVFETLTEETDVYENEFEEIWSNIIDSLLYPHSWVRLTSARSIGKLLKEYIDNGQENIGFQIKDSELQTIAYRSFRQLGAPDLSDKLASQVAKNLVFISQKWDKENTPYLPFKKENNEEAGEKESEDAEVDVKEFNSAFDWAINRCSAILKNDSRANKDMLVTKKAIIQYCAFLTKFLSIEKLKEAVSEKLLIPLIHLSEQETLYEDNENNSLPQMATTCMDLISKKLGVSEYNLLYSAAYKIIQERRQERKTKKAQLSLNNPAIALKRNFKKHAKVREKRKSEKDENGFYKPKRKKFSRG